VKTIQFHEYGSADVLTLENVDPPVPAEDELLVDVHAAGVNPVDWRYRTGQLRWYDWFTSFPRVPGSDLAGTVVETGSDVDQFEIGDEVFAMLDPLGSGTYAERVTVTADQAAHVPDGITFVEAAGIPLVSLTTLQAYRDHADLSEGEQVLVNGASGGVGTVAVQLARTKDCDVTGICSERNVELVEALGAQKVIDYNETDFTEQERIYDVVFDTIGNRTFRAARNVLPATGRYVTTDISPDRLMEIVRSRLWFGPTASAVVVTPSGEDLREIADLLEEGSLRPVVDRTYPLEEAAEAQRYSESHRASGKIILRMNSN
jgi:NADPH:quinone reductase-like Zn-dependent oxidoreductase